MPDTITTTRLVRLNLHVPSSERALCQWSLMAIATRRGIPDNRLLASGVVPLRGPDPTLEELWTAVDRVVGMHLLTD